VAHRIGRTGRAGAKGTSVSLFTEKSKWASDLVNILREAKQVVPPDLMQMAHAGGGKGGSNYSRYGGGGGGGGGGGRRW
jgi:ATP-dependent RNA helicase DDX5/DBP2